MNLKCKYLIRLADGKDLDEIVSFVDYWLRNGALSEGVEGGVNDYFIPRGRHADYIRKYNVWIAVRNKRIIGWLVINLNKTMIHLLIAAPFRGYGIGSAMVRLSCPDVIRSKTDQSTGNPKKFYEKCGYKRKHVPKAGKNHNIQIFVRS